MTALKNSRQELFTQNWFKGETKEQSAIIAGYQPKWARSTGSALSTNPNILARYDELQKKAEDDSVATVLEMKQVLTEIIRGRIGEFITNPTKEKLMSAALQELRVTETHHASVDKTVKTTTFKLHNPIQAIDQLAKLMGITREGATFLIDNSDNRSINIGATDAKNQLIAELSRFAARRKSSQDNTES